MILALNMNHLYTAQEQSLEQEAPIQTDEITKTAVEEKSNLEKWDDHLNLLSENWDTTKNVPSGTWLNPDALKLAKEIVKQDQNQAASIKAQFLDKINEIATKFTSDTLAIIKEFDDAIDAQVSSIESKAAEEKPIEPAPAVALSEEPAPTPEPVSEPESIPAPETTIPAAESTSATATTASSAESATTATPQEPKKDLETQWKEILESIKNEKEISSEQLNKAAEIAYDRIVLNGYPQEMLERDLLKSLNDKSQGTIDAAMNQFKITLAYGKQPSSYPAYMPQISPKELEAQLDAKMRAEKEKQDRKYKEAIEALAAAKKLQEEGKLSEAKLHKVVQDTKNLKQQMAEKEAEWQRQAQNASDRLAAMMKQQMVAQQKPQPNAEKGVFAQFTEAVGNWWYGTAEKTPKKISNQLSAQDQEDLLNQVVHNARDKKGAKKAFITLQQTVLDFATIKNAAEYNNWVQKMQQLINDIVITHNIMSLTKISDIVKQALLASKNIKADKIQNILDAISEKVRQEEAKKKEQKEQAEEKRRRQQEIAEQKAAAAQKIKDEENRVKAEQEKKVIAAATYKDEKKQWYDLLDKVAQNKEKSGNNAKEYTHEALKKSHSLLQLAHDIPHKNKNSISQKLKQKFSLALLEQQKNNDEDPVNIHHYMDVFNNEINKMVD